VGDELEYTDGSYLRKSIFLKVPFENRSKIINPDNDVASFKY
jgi:hypothetical protein